MRLRLNSPAVQSAFAALAYLFLTILITYPVAFQLTTRIAGLPENDSLEFVWSTWWFKYALLDLRTNPMNITILNHPDGLYFPLLPAMSQPFLLSLPLAALVSPVFAFNVTYLLSFPLCGLAGYWLCAELSGSRRAGFVGGLIWAFFPSKSGHALAGHLFQMIVFTLPLAALFLIRLLRRPSARSAVWAGLAFALAATVHPINVAYFVLPTVIVLVGAAMWPGHQVPREVPPKRVGVGWSHRVSQLPWKWLALAVVIGGGLAATLFAPAFIDAARGQLGFLEIGGAVGHSTDVLGFLLPAPGNPLIRFTPFAALDDKIVLSEFENIAYVGWIPLTLAVLGARWGRAGAESRPWIVLGALAAVLSLGPLLKFGGGLVRVSVENDSYPVVMPYALMSRLPFFQWSRTPGRLNETVLFAIAVLASLGMAELLARLKRRWLAWAAWGLACAIIPFEYIVRWPMPTAPIDAPPAIRALADDASFDAVLNFPVRINNVNLYSLLQQTYHHHPLIGGRVYRDAPFADVTHDFLSRLIRASSGGDIAPGPTDVQRLAVLSQYHVGRIVYQPANDFDGTARIALDRLLGPPSSDEGRESVAIYSVPGATLRPSDLFFIFGENWHEAESWGDRPGRWFRILGTVYVVSGSPRSGSLAFTAVPGQNLRRLIVKVNGQEIEHFGVGDWANFQTPEFRLREGLNRVEFIDEDGAWAYIGDPRCQGGSKVAGPFPIPVPCDAGRQDASDFSLAVQDLTFRNPAAQAAQAVFGDTFELFQASAPSEARPGETIVLHLVWRASRSTDRDFTVFTHLLDANGNYTTGYDSYPARGEHPTSRWHSGEVVAHNAPLSIPAEAAPGTYTLEVGWYQFESSERLAMANGETSYRVGTVVVRP